MVKLTVMQQKIYDYIVACIENQGYPPSVREIGQAVGLRSPSTVHFHLKHLEEAGVISKGPGKGRAITLTNPPLKDQVPIVGNVAAGTPILAEECIEDMLNAGILPDDLVVVRRQQTAYHGEIVVAMIDGEATVKRLSLRNGRVWLLPENEAYSPIDGTFAQILGKVIAVVRRY